MKQLGIEVVTEVAGLATGAVAGKVIGKIGYKVESKIYPVAAAAIAASLHEQLVLEEVMADPGIGKPIKIPKGMTDTRWPQEDGWQKMSWYNEEFDIEIHYVAQKKDGIITAVDDFKYKKEPRPMFFDYQGKK